MARGRWRFLAIRSRRTIFRRPERSRANSPAGLYLQELGVEPRDFNSYGSRRGNDRVMLRGTFANVRIKNLMMSPIEGGFTKKYPDGEEMSIYDAAMKYRDENVPLVIFAGKEYGTGSSRDWAAKGTMLMGVKAVIAESFERIHRSNLVGMGVLPLQFNDGQSAAEFGPRRNRDVRRYGPRIRRYQTANGSNAPNNEIRRLKDGNPCNSKD